MQIEGQIAIVTGGASGIGRAVMEQLARSGAACVVGVDRSSSIVETAKEIGEEVGSSRLYAFTGDVVDEKFRREVYHTVSAEIGTPNICVPAAGITRDRLATKVDPNTGEAVLYPVADWRLVMEVNLMAPVYWALEMVGKIAEDRWSKGLKRWSPEEDIQGTVIFIGSVSSQGNQGQISYSAAKAGLQGAAATMMKEAMFHGVRCMVIHPGFTDTPMVRQLGDAYIQNHILPATQLRRLITPEEIAHAVACMIENSAVSGEVWADAGWHPGV